MDGTSSHGDEPLAAGRTSEVYGEGDDAVVKLLRRGIDPTLADAEAAHTQAAHDAGAPAPSVHGVVDVDGRRGIVMDRIHGDAMVDEVVVEPFRMWHWARTFSDVHVSILSRRSDDLPDLKDVLGRRIEAAELTRERRAKALTVLTAAPDDDAVLHGDFHPGNVMLGEDGPVVIDWIDAARGSPAADVALTQWLLSPATVAGDTANRRFVTTLQGTFRRTYLRRVTRALRIHRKVVDAWRLPVLAARLTIAPEHEEDALHTEIANLTGGR